MFLNKISWLPPEKNGFLLWVQLAPTFSIKGFGKWDVHLSLDLGAETCAPQVFTW